MDAALKKRITDTLTTLDSYLSLHLHRGTTRDQWDYSDKQAVENAIYEARELCKELKP